ncbi:hypothetical protein A3K55_00495 [Candidatus Shapirobacteria bacterium RBG_13_44_7]|uniref:Glycosyltransferase 2-like domain-containing protein n=1 Tax=Candidatus Shapirobacteria bacterium RBG_13_44_7 TaxID=1802149 RepID=A0A1F7SE31_9BACT|nr:MAG: hypothetical protein A3K55_00495 [Candidatus Shapirobacteria bacterium RBG_13_44_7]
MTLFYRIIQKLLEKTFSLINNLLYYPHKTSFTSSGPLISVIIPVYDPNPDHLKTAIESVIDQTYQNWELIIINDASPNPQIQILLELFSNHPKIKIIHNLKNLNIVASTNLGIRESRGEYIAFFDHDDYLFPQALSYIAQNLNEITYTDEDKILNSQHSNPFFKPDFDPNLLSQVNYINHLCVFKKTFLEKLNYLRPGTDGSQDWDLLLRASKILKTSQVTHLPQILYSWRITPTSTASASGIKNSKYLDVQKTILQFNFPTSTITPSRYLGIWSHNHQPTVLPYQFQLHTLKHLSSF